MDIENAEKIVFEIIEMMDYEREDEISLSIVYPQGCKPFRENLGPDELIRRLKVSNIIPKHSPSPFRFEF